MPRVHAPSAAEAKAHPREFAILKQLADDGDVTSEVRSAQSPPCSPRCPGPPAPASALTPKRVPQAITAAASKGLGDADTVAAALAGERAITTRCVF
jgi:hypothetical protein